LTGFTVERTLFLCGFYLSRSKIFKNSTSYIIDKKKSLDFNIPDMGDKQK
jgi:hypothetical protein